MKRLALCVFALPLLAGTVACDETKVPAEEKAAVVKGNSEFAIDLYQHLKKDEKGNFFFSPYSISTALAMTHAGAGGKTEDEMARTLHFPRVQSQLHPAMAELIRDINKPNKNYKLSVANALWAHKGYKFLPEFLNLNKKYYGAGVQEVDFGATEKARKTINKWVEDQTQDKIKELFKPGVLDPLTRMVLTNAIYFQGDWASEFKKNRTFDRVFHLADGKQVKTPMMHQTAKYGYAQTDDLQVLEMPYKGDELSMVVLLPKKRDGISKLEKNLSAEQLQKWMKGVRQSKVVVSFPKFEMTSEFSLAKTLSAMGMPTAFSPAADFSGMDGKRSNLYIQAVVHKAFVKIDEKGTEAAAATGVAVGVRSAPINRLMFTADHPFVFLIRDKRTDSILFLGRMSDPSK